VDEFTNHVLRARQFEREGNCEQAAALYELAVQLYRGDLLEDERYAEWAFAMRQRLSELFATALVRLGTWRLHQGEVSQAVDLARRALEVDPVLEPGYHLVISGYAYSGQWGSARRLYDRYAETMKEYDLAPPPSISTILAEFSPQSVRQPSAR
jgi:DNA-binding SARP family transcriptional activator